VTGPGEFLSSNRALWNEWVDINARSAFYGLEEFRRGGTRLRPYELEEVGAVEGKSLLHLQCHFGMDTLSWAREGARVIGVDFSERGIVVARRLAEELALEASFVHSNLYDLRSNLDGKFDVVYTSRGVLNWLPDLNGWADVVAHFVRPGGIFYITEVHPFALVFDDEVEEPVLRLRYPYWTTEKPIKFDNVGSYADRSAPVIVPFEYDWSHGLGEVVTAISSAGLTVEFLHEFDFTEWPMPPLVEREGDEWRMPRGRFGEPQGELPLFFSLRARKRGQPEGRTPSRSRTRSRRGSAASSRTAGPATTAASANVSAHHHHLAGQTWNHNSHPPPTTATRHGRPVRSCSCRRRKASAGAK